MQRASSSSGKREPQRPLQTYPLRTQTSFFHQNRSTGASTGAAALSPPTRDEALPKLVSVKRSSTPSLSQTSERAPARLPAVAVNVSPQAISHMLEPPPGALDLRNGLDQAVFSKITKAIADRKKIMIFIDWDDAAVLFEPNGKLKTNYVNTPLVDYLAHLFNTFGIEHFELRILSARLNDKYMSASEENIKLAQLWPVFLRALQTKMKQPFQKQVHAYCLMGWKNFIFYGRKGNEVIEIGRVNFQFNLNHLSHEGKYIRYSKEALEQLGFVSPSLLQKMIECSEVYVRFFHVTKANYLIRDILTEEFMSQYVCLHIDDNTYQLSEMRRLNIDITLIPVIPQPRGLLQPLIISDSFRP